MTDVCHDAPEPDPGGAADLAEFINLLTHLRMHVGAPSYRTLARRVGQLLHPAHAVSHVTVTDLFNPRRRRLDLDLVVALVRAMGLNEEGVAAWRRACVRVHAAAKTGGLSGSCSNCPRTWAPSPAARLR